MVEIIRKQIEARETAISELGIALEQHKNREIPVPDREDLQADPDAWYDDQVRCLRDRIDYEDKQIQELEMYDSICKYIERAKNPTRTKVQKRFKLSKKHARHYIKTLKRAKLLAETHSGKMKILKVVESDS